MTAAHLNKLDYLNDEEFKEIKNKIVEEYGTPLEALGYHISVALYQRENKKESSFHKYIDENGREVQSSLVLPETVTNEDKWSQCVGKVIYMGDEAYKTGKFRKDRSYGTFQTYNEFITACELISESRFCPEQYKGKIGDISCAIQLGMRHDFAPMESLLKIGINDNGIPFIKDHDEEHEKIKHNVFSFIKDTHTKPWCKLGDWVVCPRHEGVLLNYKGFPVMVIPDDRIICRVENPLHISRF